MEYSLNSADFTRTRKLPVEHTVGIVMHIAASRNSDGYAITAQKSAAELGRFVDEEVLPLSRQAVSQAREKLDWEAFRYPMREANQDTKLDGDCFRYRGHITRAADGTRLTLPHSEGVLRCSSAGPAWRAWATTRER